MTPCAANFRARPYAIGNDAAQPAGFARNFGLQAIATERQAPAGPEHAPGGSVREKHAGFGVDQQNAKHEPVQDLGRALGLRELFVPHRLLPADSPEPFLFFTAPVLRKIQITAKETSRCAGISYGGRVHRKSRRRQPSVNRFTPPQKTLAAQPGPASRGSP
jgi:hypothetical protein